MRYGKLIVAGMLVFLAAFTFGCMALFYYKGLEPTTLILSVFAFCGVEGGLMAWIRTEKAKKTEGP
ncbi:hypothetical protein [Anaerotalea alkaliphila]|uniref:Lipoprotein n=1 Tax=Anaerotalea alkaliphila TaxID=2662126 RepID=A0A7X5HWZ0_9FIRM|nr:hypothetical protein [Anaerotalea alkaliphila]NDL68006.1 hypothetical protein [Anaerotalea alkaliphila]